MRVDTALEEGLPFCDPAFYASETLCPDALIEHIFRPAAGCIENIPLLKERIAVLRENGAVLINVRVHCSLLTRSFCDPSDAITEFRWIIPRIPLRVPRTVPRPGYRVTTREDDRGVVPVLQR